MTPCQQENFSSVVGVHRIADAGQPMVFIADGRIAGPVCHQRFRVLGVDAGLSFEVPRVDVTGPEINLPIEPELIPMLHQRMRYDRRPVIP